MKRIFKTKKSRVFAIVLTVILVLVILIARACSSATKALSGLGGMVTTVTVETRDLSDAMTLTGTVKGVRVNNVTSEAPTKFTAVNVSVGDTVKEGDLLATLDPTDIEASIKDTNKALGNTNALANLSNERDKQNLQKAKDAYDKQLKEAGENLSAIGEGIAIWEDTKTKDKKVMDDAKAALDADPDNAAKQSAYAAARAEYEYACSYQSGLQAKYDAAKKAYDEMKENPSDAIDAAEYAVEASKYTDNTSSTKQALKSLKEQLDGCNVYAPISGVVTAVNVAVGDNNAPGKTIITIQDTSTMVLDTPVDETQILKLQENMEATVTSPATGDKKLKGTVTRVVRVKSAAGLDGSGGTYAAEITLEDSELLVGMSAKAKIVLKERKSILAVPYDLIQEDENGNTYVLAAEKNDDGTYTAVRRNIQVGEEINYYTEVLGGDLQEGDEIFFDSAIEEGQKIIVMNGLDGLED